MPVKKKSPVKKLVEKELVEEQVDEKPPVVRQVVEEVDTTKTEDVGESLEEIKEDAQHIEELVEDLKPGVLESEKLVEDQEEIKREEAKSVVGELYKPQRREFGPEISVSTKGSKKSLLLWAIIVIIVALVTGGILIGVTRGGFSAISVPSIGSTPTPTETPSPTPSPTPQVINRSDVTIQVLNGGGVSGAAGAMKAFLEEKGYTVSDVGNTDEYTYETTEVIVKSDGEGILNILKTDLSEKYTVGNTATDLSDDETFDAQVIVGKE